MKKVAVFLIQKNNRFGNVKIPIAHDIECYSWYFDDNKLHFVDENRDYITSLSIGKHDSFLIEKQK